MHCRVPDKPLGCAHARLWRMRHPLRSSSSSRAPAHAPFEPPSPKTNAWNDSWVLHRRESLTSMHREVNDTKYTGLWSWKTIPRR